MKIRKQIEAVALEAGKIILSADSIQAATDEKSGHANFVTEYDKKVQEFLFEKLDQYAGFLSICGSVMVNQMQKCFTIRILYVITLI